MQIPCAYLRIFVPADQLAADETAKVLHATTDPSDSFEQIATERFGILLPHEPRAGWHMDGPSGPLVCPARVRLRSLAGILTVQDQFREDIAAAFVPETLAGAVADELEMLRYRGDLKTYVLQSPWHVPLRWFLAFEPSERKIDPESGSPRFETVLDNARERVSRVAEVIEAAGIDGSIVTLVSDMNAWFDEFPGDESILQLDYGSVAKLIDADDLESDTSVADMQAAVSALEANDWERAGGHYGQVSARWAAIRTAEMSN